jgi:histidine ammonia-lyase
MLEGPLTWRQVAAVAEGAPLHLSCQARARLADARRIVEAIVERGMRAYGVNTGVGALCEVVVDRECQSRLSHNLLMSHACGVGPALPEPEARSIICAAVNNYCHGHSGLRPQLVEGFLALLTAGCVPEIPAGGSVGYLTHMAHASLVLVGHGWARIGDRRIPGREALRLAGLDPMTLEAKEGLSLINGTPCATGLACLALCRAERLLDWADGTGAMVFENLGGRVAAFDPAAIDLHHSPGLRQVAARMRSLLAGSAILDPSRPARTQEPLSLRAIPQVHGAARDHFDHIAAVVDRELASVTDNPAVAGTPDAPAVYSEAHAVGQSLAISLDTLAIMLAEIGAIAERRIDRLVNPHVSGLPPFLTTESGVGSGFMIAQYTAAALVAENRRLAQPASTGGGITSALQEDHLTHSTPAALKALALIANVETILAIELLAAAQSYDLQDGALRRAPGTDAIYRTLRSLVPAYGDDRPLADDIDIALKLIRQPLGNLTI